MVTEFYVSALEEAMPRYGIPAMFNLENSRVFRGALIIVHQNKGSDAEIPPGVATPYPS